MSLPILFKEVCRGIHDACLGCDECKNSKVQIPLPKELEWPFEEEHTAHPSTVMCLDEILPMQHDLQPIQRSMMTTIASSKVEICGLINEYGVVCNRIRNPQSEAKTADGSIRCRGCKMVRTPLLKIQDDVYSAGKLHVETGRLGYNRTVCIFFIYAL